MRDGVEVEGTKRDGCVRAGVREATAGLHEGSINAAYDTEYKKRRR